MTLRVLLVDDHKVLLDGLRVLLSGRQDLEVVDAVSDGRAAIEAARQLRPHLIVSDLEMCGMNGIEAIRHIVSELPQIKIVCLSMHSEPKFVEAAFAAGASGYVIKDYAFEELLRAIRAVAAGEVFVCPATTRHLVEVLKSRTEEATTAFHLLTSREREVLQLLAEGLSSKQIAGRLRISVKTVGTHRENIVEKTGLHSVAGLTKYALSEGLTDPASGL